MPRLINPFSAGQDAMLGFLAEREQRRMLDEDRSRRDRLDQESFADRQRMRELQEGQLASIDEDRSERRQLLQDQAAEKKRAAEAQALNAEQIGALLDAYDSAQTPEEKHAIGLRILNAGGKYQQPPNEPAAPRPMSVSPGSTVIDPTTGKPIFTAPERPEKPSAADRDDPALPRGTKAWIESIAQRGIPIADARAELSKGWTQQKAAHGRAELGKAADYLNSLYPLGEDPLAARQRAPLAPAAPAAPAGGDVPPAVQDLLKNVPPNRKVTLKDGSVWMKLPDGTIQKGS